MEIGTTIIPRGKGFYNDPVRAADKTTWAQSTALEGTIRKFHREVETFIDGTSGPKVSIRRDVICILVRNNSSEYLKPKRAVVWDTDYIGRRVSGYANGDAVRVAGIVDEFFSPAGVPPGELFWITVKGPTVWSKLEYTGSGNINKGDNLVARQASGALAGDPAKQTLPTSYNADTVSARVQNKVAVALKSATETTVDPDFLVDVCLY